jgi:hypothetical protein
MEQRFDVVFAGLLAKLRAQFGRRLVGLCAFAAAEQPQRLKSPAPKLFCSLVGWIRHRVCFCLLAIFGDCVMFALFAHL